MTTYDRREMILERLFTLLSNLTIPLTGDPDNGHSPTITTGSVVRNRNELPEGKVPGIILLDADEQRETRATLKERGQTESRVPAQLMRMTPEIYVVLDTRSITNLNVGKDLNFARLTILAAVLPDGELQKIVGSNGNIVYDGTVTDLARNRMMKGQLGISITFQYPLLHSEYAGLVV